MDRNSNAYTFIFAVTLVVIVAAVLAFSATSLKPLQDNNVRNEKMQNILTTLNIEAEKSDIDKTFNQYIKQQLSLKSDGTVDADVNAFKIDLKKELKKPINEQRFPLYIAEKDGKKFYIVPLYGAGLWDAIWGYIALEEDQNTIIGAVFDHKAETPGLGAEINQQWFGDMFIGKKILKDANLDFTAEGNFVSVTVVKGGTPDDNLHGVDGISGGTITGDALARMIQERMSNYLPYFQNN
ncbi:MAG: NADH:ubiquinone reductase (Na(+)-transporting) subunit C [Flavobacteriaceae bacterium]|nr:NADH:ubiquinone reductase (Na(+)-transporting) subunit C [Flavobacteriaceae bacterium]